MSGGPPPLPSWAQSKPRGGGPPAPESPLDRQFAAFIGPRWETYRRKFAPFFEEPRFQPTWNWSAALLWPMWFFYRRLYVLGIGFAFLPSIGFGLLWKGAPPAIGPDGKVIVDPDAVAVIAGILLSTSILSGGTANWLLYRRAVTAFRVVQMQALDEPRGLAFLARIGRVSWIAVSMAIIGLALLNRLGMAAMSALGGKP